MQWIDGNGLASFCDLIVCCARLDIYHARRRDVMVSRRSGLFGVSILLFVAVGA